MEQAEHDGKLPNYGVQCWLQEAYEVIKNAEEMQEEFRLNEENFGWCLDCRSHYKLGKHIVQATQKVKNHKVEKNSFHEIAVPPLPEPVSQLPTTFSEKEHQQWTPWIR